MKWERTENDDVVDQRPAPSEDRSSSSGDSGGGGGGYESRVSGVESHHHHHRSYSSSRSAPTTKLGIAGTVVGLIALGAFKLFGGGGDKHSSTNTSKPAATTPAPAPKAAPPKATAPAVDPDAELVAFVKFALKDIQETFDGLYKTQRRKETYRHAKLVLFKDEVATGCGDETARTGPFYCGKDERAYVDLSWFHRLAEDRNAPGNFAQAYVLAHELGHHIQRISGMQVQVSQLTNGKDWNNALQVRQELQADCLAGVWGHSANARKLLEIGDLDKALAAASAVGSDKTRPGANPETFTHGTSEQRMRWFKIGFDSGKLDACNTFDAKKL